IDMNDFLPLPRGVYFKPTDEQLIEHYLKNKIASEKMDFDFIDLDLNEIEPWDIPGYWRAEGTGCAIYSDDENDHNSLIGMKKPLAFFQGREPNGLLSQWFMFEYRLETNEDESGTLLQAQEPLLQKLLLLENQLRPLLKGLPAATVEESNQRIGQY
ncbi:NAC domain-containing protein, partial [Trifolium pratense]